MLMGGSDASSGFDCSWYGKFRGVRGGGGWGGGQG